MKTNLLSIEKGILNVELEFSDYKDSPERGFFFCYLFDRFLSLKYVSPMRDTAKFYPEALKNGEIDIPLNEFLDILKASIFRWEDGRWILNPNEQ
jgi:hypothetical protein